MKKNLLFIVVILVFILVLILLKSRPRSENPQIIAWTCTTESGSKNVVIYSTDEKAVVKQIPGTLIIGRNRDDLICYEYENKIVSLYSISPEWTKVKVADVNLPHFSRVVAWIDDSLFFINDNAFMRASVTGEQVVITKLNGEDKYYTIPQPSYDGKWTYSYRDESGYYIDILTSNGEVIDTIEGLHPVWCDSNHLMFKSTLQDTGLSVYSCLTHSINPALTLYGKEYDVEYSLLYTCGISIDSLGAYMVYSIPKRQSFLGLESDLPQNMTIVMLNLENGKKSEIALSQQDSTLLWHIANIPFQR